jgi:hypothetical protein
MSRLFWSRNIEDGNGRAGAPIAWYSYDDLKRWDYSQQTLTLSLEVDNEFHADSSKKLRRQLSFETKLGEMVCQLLTETHREGWQTKLPSIRDGLGQAAGQQEGGGLPGEPAGAAPRDRELERRRRYLLSVDELMTAPDDMQQPRLIFGNDVAHVCGRHDQVCPAQLTIAPLN